MMLEGDVLLFDTLNGGEVNFINGQPEMTAGFETALYLCLFGGNHEDDGLPANRKTWWSNLNETIPYKKYVSRFQNLVRKIPLITGNLRRLEDAALADLQGFKEEGIAGEIKVAATIPKLNFLKLQIEIISPTGENSQTEFLINWLSYTE